VARAPGAQGAIVLTGLHGWNTQTLLQGGNTRQLLQKEIEEEHRAAAIELMLRRRAMIKELYSRESQQYRCRTVVVAVQCMA
jgi:hypothetical protein